MSTGMKRVLVLNADSFVGTHVCRCFHEAKEYIVDGTLHRQSAKERSLQQIQWCAEEELEESLQTSPRSTQMYNYPTTEYSVSLNQHSDRLTATPRHTIPLKLRPYLNAVMPNHDEITDFLFRDRLLSYDIIVAVLEDNAFEADCAIKILQGSHYEVEKTFVLVSNVMTWTQTDRHEHEVKLMKRREKREAERARRIEDGEEEGEEEEEEEEEEMQLKVWTEDEYRRRYPDTRYHSWRALERLVKRANSETLHTYVLWAGLPYGCGEDLLEPCFLSAWRHQQMLQYGDGSNYVPTIHVKDLSRIIFLLGSSYDTLDDRYMFAVDQGNNTQAEILQGIKEYVGGEVAVTDPVVDRDVFVLTEMRMQQEESERKKLQDEVSDEIQQLEDMIWGLRYKKKALLGDLRVREKQELEWCVYKSLISAESGGSSEGINEQCKKQIEEDMDILVKLQEEIDNAESLLKEKQQHRGILREHGLLKELTKKERKIKKISEILKLESTDLDSLKMATCTTTTDEDLMVDAPRGLPNWFSAVNVRCEPGAVLSLLDESEWTCIGGFCANLEKVVQEFKAERKLQPMRIVLSGPPLSGSGEISSKLAQLFGIVHLTEENVIEAFKSHVADIRAKIIEIILRRRSRRHAAREERIRRERQRRIMKRRRRKVSNNDNQEEEEEEEAEEDAFDEDEEQHDQNDEIGDDEEIDEEFDEEEDEDGMVAGVSRIPLNLEVSEKEILNGFEEEEEEEEEDELSDVDTAVGEEAMKVLRKMNEEERIQIETCREDYRFYVQILKLHLVNGEFPLPPQEEEEEEEEEEEQEEREESEKEDEEGAGEEEDMALGAAEEGQDVSQNGTPVRSHVSDAPPPPVIRYLDEALAVMVRWRLRQEDCKNQGYILENFPSTVRQARLVFLADAEEQKQPKQTASDGEWTPPKPHDISFPLPVIEEMEEEQKKDMLNMMNGKAFLSAEEALVPTNDVLFPDCFIYIQCGTGVLQYELAAMEADAGSKCDGLAFYEKLTQFLSNNRPNAPPTESLLCWFQTVTVEKLESDDEAPPPVGPDGEELDSGDRAPRVASVVFVPSFTKMPSTQVQVGMNTVEPKDNTNDGFDEYCEKIRKTVLRNIGLSTCGEKEAVLSDKTSAEQQQSIFEYEMEALEGLRRVVSDAEARSEEAALEKERCKLRLSEAKEMALTMEGVEGLPTEVYLMRYVLPSLTPLMAEVVRLRPEDPVTVFADALFNHKRQTEL
ncbi:Dpy 30 motif [Trypanosoma vivax]|nr:hypothetical protein TRVL_03049 [Trypanosoma vivax]KAH8617361.1 Dpy 30 motif [Trypanosoma vivax]